MKMQKTQVPQVQTPVVDRIVSILQWKTPDNYPRSNLRAKHKQRVQTWIDRGACEKAYAHGGRYAETFRVLLPGGQRAFVQLGELQPERQKGGLRFMVNPARFREGDVERLHKVLGSIIGKELYAELLQRPLINAIDFAVDVENLLLEDLLVNYKNSQKRTMFAKRTRADGSVEGFNFGSVSSDYMAAVYEKSIERRHAAVVNIARYGLGTEQLKANVVRQLDRAHDGPDVVRVEVRGKKLRGLPLHKLNGLPNRFARFEFAQLGGDGPHLPPLTRQAFVSMSRDIGVRAALAAFKGKSSARKVRAFWRARQASWWKPEGLWEDACGALREVGLFPDEAFEPYEDAGDDE